MYGKTRIANLAAAAAMVGLVGGAGAMLVGCHNGAGTSSTDASHSCKGQNACKGQGNCKTADHACKGQNACKGQGGCHA
jgi:hypothetical protein